MKDLVTYIVKAIVETPNAVNVDEEVLADGKIILTIHTAPTDVGLVIGKMGKTINAIRSLVKIKAIKEGKFVDVKVPSDRPPKSERATESAPAESNGPDSMAVTGEFDAPDF